MIEIDRINALATAAAKGGVRDDSAGDGGQLSFGAFVANGLSSTAGAIKDAERASMGAMLGNVSVRQAVNSLMQAEQMLQTMLAIREKATSALQEVTHMSI